MAEEPEATARGSRLQLRNFEELFHGVVAQNLFDVVNEYLLRACRIGLLAKQCLGCATHSFGDR